MTPFLARLLLFAIVVSFVSAGVAVELTRPAPQPPAALLAPSTQARPQSPPFFEPAWQVAGQQIARIRSGQAAHPAAASRP